MAPMRTPSSETMRTPSLAPAPPLWRRLLPWIMAVGLLGVLVWKVDKKALLDSLRSVPSGSYLVFIAIFSVTNLACDAMATWKAYGLLTKAISFRALLTVRGASYLPSILNYHAGQAYMTYLLSRKYQVPLTRVVGGTLMVYATTLGNFVALASLSLLIPMERPSWVAPTVTVLLIAGLVYLCVLMLKPKVLLKVSVLTALFDAGALGHMRLMLWRLPHVLVLTWSLWIAYRFFHIEIPLQAGLSHLPLILLVSALPITPQGAGTREIMALKLLTPFVHTVDGGDLTAPVVAAGGAFMVTATLMQALLGFSFLTRGRAILTAKSITNVTQ
jgi:Lysylphosphatidylglycerol synthase TM region